MHGSPLLCYVPYITFLHPLYASSCFDDTGGCYLWKALCIGISYIYGSNINNTNFSNKK